MADEPSIIDSLREKVRTLPTGPGCYLMKDSAGAVLYVGKARNLRSRVGSYFSDSADLTPAKRRMVEEIVDIDYLETADEVDAVLTEARLIKDIHPPYNVRLMDDKTFPYLEITLQDDFPGVYFTREPHEKSRLYGPFTSAVDLRNALPILQGIFRFRTCELEIRADDRRRRYNRPCLLHAIDRCYGPCADLIAPEDYRRMIKRLQRFLEGKRAPLLRAMKREMQTLSSSQAYEEAARVRDQIRAIESLGDRGDLSVHVQPEVFRRDMSEGLRELARLVGRDNVRIIEGVDIAHLGGRETVGSLVQFIDGRPLKNGYRRFKIRTADPGDDYAAIGEVIFRHFRRIAESQAARPDLLMIDGGPGQLKSGLEALAAISVTDVSALGLAKRAEEIYLPGREEPIRLPRRSEALKILQYVRDEAHRFAQHYHHILRRKSMLGAEADQKLLKDRRRSSLKRRTKKVEPDEEPKHNEEET